MLELSNPYSYDGWVGALALEVDAAVRQAHRPVVVISSQPGRRQRPYSGISPDSHRDVFPNLAGRRCFISVPGVPGVQFTACSAQISGVSNLEIFCSKLSIFD